MSDCRQARFGDQAPECGLKWPKVCSEFAVDGLIDWVLMFQWIVISATCTLLSGSLCSSRHVSHVCGYAKESRSSPVALSSFSTFLCINLNHVLVSCGLEKLLDKKGHSFYGKVGEFDRLVALCEPAFVRRLRHPAPPLVKGRCVAALLIYLPVRPLVPSCNGAGLPSLKCCCIFVSDDVAVIPRGSISRLSLFSSILVARQNAFRCFSNSGSSTRDLRKAMESSAKCPSLRVMFTI
eukprot:6213404-Pleurochrysis_carterae.AAC.2